MLVAMSGGVDSSVAAHYLKRAGHEVIGATVKTWTGGECGREGDKLCCSRDAVDSARAVARRIGIPHHVFDMSDLFTKEVRRYGEHEYRAGRTPNPCVVCNSKIKFGALLEKARRLRCSYIASGHYARIVHEKTAGRYRLRKGRDGNTDQSYFLFNLNQRQLGRIIFPLGAKSKQTVRRVAKRHGLPSHAKPSSQDLCFSYDGTAGTPGPIVFRDGAVLGTHRGIANYTIGQRKGLNVAFREPLYVTAIDARNNTIFVGTKEDTGKREIHADGVHWIDKISLPATVKVKIRHRHQEAPARLYAAGRGAVRIVFTAPQVSPSPGQAAVFYKRGYVIGGGWIGRVI